MKDRCNNWFIGDFEVWEDVSFTIGSESASTPTNSSSYVGLLISVVISWFFDEALINVKGTAMKISQLGFAFVKPNPFAFVWRWQFQLQPQPNRAQGKGDFSGFIENKAGLPREDTSTGHSADPFLTMNI